MTASLLMAKVQKFQSIKKLSWDFWIDNYYPSFQALVSTKIFQNFYTEIMRNFTKLKEKLGEENNANASQIER